MLKKIVYILMLSMFAVTTHAQVVAIVGNKKITLNEFKQRYDEIKSQAINPPSPQLFLEDLVRYEMGVQEAEKRKLRNDPLVEEEIKKVLYKQLVEKAIGDQVNKIKVSESEMRRYYRDNPELRTSHILIEVKPGANQKQRAAARKRANEIYAEVQKSKRPFEELVKLYTDDTLSKTTGGDIGYQTKVTLVPSYYNLAKSMKVGQVRGVVETRYGFHIIKLTGKRAYSQARKNQIRAAVFDEKRKEIFDNYFGKLRKNYKLSVNKDLVKNVK